MSGRLSRSLDKVAAALAPAFDCADVELAKATLKECCTATRRVRAGKDPTTGSFLYADVPDHPVRLAASVKIIEWSIGKPIARTVQATFTPTAGAGGAANGEDLLNLLLSAPDAAVDIVEKLKRAAEKAKRAEPVEIAVTPGK
jgi:hypothetical protein